MNDDSKLGRQTGAFRSRYVLLMIILASILVGLASGVFVKSAALGFLYAFIALFTLVSCYALAAAVFGLPKLKWNDVTAIWYMLP